MVSLSCHVVPISLLTMLVIGIVVVVAQLQQLAKEDTKHGGPNVTQEQHEVKVRWRGNSFALSFPRIFENLAEGPAAWRQRIPGTQH